MRAVLMLVVYLQCYRYIDETGQIFDGAITIVAWGRK